MRLLRGHYGPDGLNFLSTRADVFRRACIFRSSHSLVVVVVVVANGRKDRGQNKKKRLTAMTQKTKCFTKKIIIVMPPPLLLSLTPNGQPRTQPPVRHGRVSVSLHMALAPSPHVTLQGSQSTVWPRRKHKRAVMRRDQTQYAVRPLSPWRFRVSILGSAWPSGG